jgi:regulator of protease activity HflC (stomatin/prohibitin superfamily)
MKLRTIAITSILVSSIFLTGCAQVIENGEVGLRLHSWNGKLDDQELYQGLHTTFTSNIITFSTRENIFSVSNLNPITKNKTVMSDFDINVNYSVNPKYIAEMYTKYSKTYNESNGKGEILPMVGFIRRFVNSAVNKSVGQYEALEINTNRSEIEEDIKRRLTESLNQEGLDGKIMINSVNITNAQLPKSLVESVNRQVAAQAELAAKTIEVQTAQKEAERIKYLAVQADGNYIRLLEAQAKMEAAKNGNLIIVPDSFTSLGRLK